MTAIDIRTMEAVDLPAVLDIQARCYTEVTLESEESFLTKLRASPSTCFIASLDKETVGYPISLPWGFSHPPMLNAETCRLPPSPDCLYLHDLAVAPDARKSGVGRALVEAFLTRLRGLDLVRASLIAVQSSVPYWERHGFRTVPLSESLSAGISTYGEGARYMERAAISGRGGCRSGGRRSRPR